LFDDGPTVFSAASKEEWTVETSSSRTLGKELRNLETSPPAAGTLEMNEFSPDISVKYRTEPSEAKLDFTNPSCVIWRRLETLAGKCGRLNIRNKNPTEAMTIPIDRTEKPFFRGTGELR
jgi:hypothetical protein